MASQIHTSDEMNAKNPALLNRRYPPISEKLSKRWSSVAEVSYTIQPKNYRRKGATDY